LISENHEKGIPIMAIVKNQPCCWWKLNIPNGIYTMEQRFGVDHGIMDPGWRCCYTTCCGMNKLMVMISKNSIRFKCTVQNIPTKDNVRVQIEIGVNFHIGNIGKESEQEDLKKFFYNFGPNRLEELLQEECDEGIRDFIK
jgi:hypothetical protein